MSDKNPPETEIEIQQHINYIANMLNVSYKEARFNRDVVVEKWNIIKH